MIKKILQKISLLFTLGLSYAVQVQQVQNPSVAVQKPTSMWVYAGIGLLVAIILGGLLILFFWIIYKIYKKFQDDARKSVDLEFYKFTTDIKMCRINSDGRFRYGRWWTFFLFKKRASIYADTENGLRHVGYYDGHAIKKEEYLIIGLFQKTGLFTSETDVLIIPYQLKHFVKFNDDFSLTIKNCEGVDEVMSSEFFSMPVFNAKRLNEKERYFVDFSNHVLENYFRTYAYRDVIKNNISEFRENIRDATEMNSTIQLKRKGGGDLNTNSGVKDN